MTKKAMPQSLAFGGAFDQSRQIGDDEGPMVVDPHDTEGRLQGGEGIVRDLGLGRGQP
jgi:hypothetical protein